jgi:hypothetical protein
MKRRSIDHARRPRPLARSRVESTRREEKVAWTMGFLSNQGVNAQVRELGGYCASRSKAVWRKNDAWCRVTPTLSSGRKPL